MKYLFGRYSYPTVLALAAAAILGIGLLLKPERPDKAKPTISETETARLEKYSQRKSLAGIAKYFSGLADEVSPQVVRIRGANASGLVWKEKGRIVTAGLPDGVPDGALAVASSGGQAIPAPVASGSPDVPVAALSATVDGAEPVSLARTADVRSGEWVLEVARRSDGTVAFAPAILSGTAAATCGEFSFREVQLSAPIPSGMAGGGVFDMDGKLLGAIVRCGDRGAAMSVDGVDAALHAGEGRVAAVLRRYGLRVAPVIPDTPWIFAKKGALVSEVRRGRPADVSGIEPGDVIVACDGSPVDSPENLYGPLTDASTAEHDVQLRRGPRLVRLKLNAMEAPPGVVVERPERGFVMETVPRGTRSWRAGVRAGDRIVSINGRPPVTPAAIERALADSAAPCYIVIDRGARSLGLVAGK